MTVGGSFEGDLVIHPLLGRQAQLQKSAEYNIAICRYSAAAVLIEAAGDYRDEYVRSNQSEVAAVDSSLSYNQTLHLLLNQLVESGNEPSAEQFVTRRLRRTANPYEASGLLYWAGMNEAQKGNFTQASDLVKKSEEVSIEIGSPWLAAQAENLLSRISEDLEDDSTARKSLEDALDNLDKGEASDLYFPDRYMFKISYGVKHRLRMFLGQRLFYGREREAMDFCNEALASGPGPSRLGFFHQWMGMAAIGKVGEQGSRADHLDIARAAAHLRVAEQKFVEAEEPVYAGLTVIDQMAIGVGSQLSQKINGYLRVAIDQCKAFGSPELAAEINFLVNSLPNRIATTRIYPN